MRPPLPVSRYHVPLFVYSPAHVQPRRIERRVGQIDVAPTLPGLLHRHYNSRSFGKDILRMGDAYERVPLSSHQYLDLLVHQPVAWGAGQSGIPAAWPRVTGIRGAQHF